MASTVFTDDYVRMPHRITLAWSDEDDAWIARFPELRGCVAHGESPEDAIRRGYDMKRLWVEAGIDSGSVIPRPQPLIEEVDDDVVARIRLAVDALKRSRDAFRSKSVYEARVILEKVLSDLGTEAAA